MNAPKLLLAFPALFLSTGLLVACDGGSSTDHSHTDGVADDHEHADGNADHTHAIDAADPTMDHTHTDAEGDDHDHADGQPHGHEHTPAAAE